MKKAILITAITLILVSAALVVLWFRLPAVVSYVAKKTAGIGVEVSSVRMGYGDGLLRIALRGITLQGNLEGKIRECSVLLAAAEGLRFKEIDLSDFDLRLGASEGISRLPPLKVERINVERGRFAYKTEQFLIHQITLQREKEQKSPLFTAYITDSRWFESLRIEGEGTLLEDFPRIKGQFHLTGFPMEALDKDFKGRALVSGTFVMQDGKVTLEGPFEMENYEMKAAFLTKPLLMESTKGRVAVMDDGKNIRVDIREIPFDGALFTVNITATRSEVTSVGLSSDFINLATITKYISIKDLSNSGWEPWDYLKDGRVKIHSLVYRTDSPLTAKIELQDGSITYKDITLGSAEGLFSVDAKGTYVSAGKTRFRSSSAENIDGIVPFKSNKMATVRGDFSVDLQDVPFLVDTGDLQFHSGSTVGSAEVEISGEDAFKVGGKGTFVDADVSWRELAASARGSYRFTNDEIAFAPLVVRKGDSELRAKGTWSQKRTAFDIKGLLDVNDMAPLFTPPFDAAGIARVDVRVGAEEGMIDFAGEIVTDDVYYTIPKFFKKEKGIPSRTDFKASMKDGNVVLERLRHRLDIIDLALSGRMDAAKNIDLTATLGVHAIERAASLFFPNGGDTPMGNVDLDVTVKGLHLPLQKLPEITGKVKIEKGFFRLPWLDKPLKEINLISDFQGNKVDIDVKRLVCGTTVLKEGKIVLTGLESPRLNVYLDLDNFNLDDFGPKREVKLSPIPEEGILARTTGQFLLRTKAIQLGRIQAENLQVEGTIGERQFKVPSLQFQALEGKGRVRGSLDLSGQTPVITLNGRFRDMKSGLFLELLGGKSTLIEGRANLIMDLKTGGKEPGELLRSLEGSVTVGSKEGVIKRWNLLSKVLGLLNVIDLVRGKVAFSQDGLPYATLGGTFEIGKGVFRTSNFLIDSSSMLITGQGTIDPAGDRVDLDIAVSPLVTLDTLISKIPLLRTVLQRKGKGFLYAAYRVTGPVDDPDVSLSMVDTVGGRTLEILKNILTLPADIFNQ
jgi:hypothetical protein